ncbi:MAG: hypothetical protein IJB24_05135 [Clostridia bacterium]|nr:hypothetical protein [Clostridia bacterium]
MKRLLYVMLSMVLIITLTSCMKSAKSYKKEIYGFVEDKEQNIRDAIAELERLCEDTELDDGEYIDGAGNSEFNSYADANGLYLDIEKPGTVGRELEIENDILDKILNGKPVEDIARDGNVIIFNCGGEGIVPSSQDYYFYYSPDDEPVAVFDTEVVCTTSQMSPEGNGYVYYDEHSNGFYTEKIIDNFYYCKAEF